MKKILFDTRIWLLCYYCKKLCLKIEHESSHVLFFLYRAKHTRLRTSSFIITLLFFSIWSKSSFFFCFYGVSLSASRKVFFKQSENWSSQTFYSKSARGEYLATKLEQYFKLRASSQSRRSTHTDKTSKNVLWWSQQQHIYYLCLIYIVFNQCFIMFVQS